MYDDRYHGAIKITGIISTCYFDLFHQYLELSLIRTPFSKCQSPWVIKPSLQSWAASRFSLPPQWQDRSNNGYISRADFLDVARRAGQLGASSSWNEWSLNPTVNGFLSVLINYHRKHIIRLYIVSLMIWTHSIINNYSIIIHMISHVVFSSMIYTYYSILSFRCLCMTLYYSLWYSKWLWLPTPRAFGRKESPSVRTQIL